VKKAGDAAAGSSGVVSGEFNFEEGLSHFKKDEVLAEVATTAEASKVVESKYKKDDFFDSLSCDILDREEGRKTRLNGYEERQLNQDTFGAIALQSHYRRGGFHGRGGRGRGGRGGGRGYGGRGRGGGGRGRGGQAQASASS
jgi:protein LSM14